MISIADEEEIRQCERDLIAKHLESIARTVVEFSKALGDPSWDRIGRMVAGALKQQAEFLKRVEYRPDPTQLTFPWSR